MSTKGVLNTVRLFLSLFSRQPDNKTWHMYLKKLGAVGLPLENQVLDFLNKYFFPEFANIARQIVHTERQIQIDGANLTTLRDLNNGYTFKGEFLLRCFPDWGRIYNSIVSLVGPVNYALPHIVLHTHDLPIHVDRRFFSVNIGLVNPTLWETQVFNYEKTKVLESARYGYGEFIGLDTRQFHTVVNLTSKPEIHGFLVFTPLNDISQML